MPAAFPPSSMNSWTVSTFAVTAITNSDRIGERTQADRAQGELAGVLCGGHQYPGSGTKVQLEGSVKTIWIPQFVPGVAAMVVWPCTQPPEKTVTRTR